MGIDLGSATGINEPTEFSDIGPEVTPCAKICYPNKFRIG